MAADRAHDLDALLAAHSVQRDLEKMRMPAPGRDIGGPVGDQHQYRRIGHPRYHLPYEGFRRRIDPVRVFQYEQNWALQAQRQHVADHRLDGMVAALLGGQFQRAVTIRRRQRKQRREQWRICVHILFRHPEQQLQFVELVLRPVGV